MSKFKVGDRVRIAESSEYYGKGESDPKDVDGTVDGTLDGIKGSNYSIHAEWDNGEANIYRESDLELVESKPEFKVGHGAICVKGTYKYGVGDVVLIKEIHHLDGSLKVNKDDVFFDTGFFTPCPNPPLPHYKERIAHALGASIEMEHAPNKWGKSSYPQFFKDYNYKVKMPDIHAEERESIKREIAELQKKLEGLGGGL